MTNLFRGRSVHMLYTFKLYGGKMKKIILILLLLILSLPIIAQQKIRDTNKPEFISHFTFLSGSLSMWGVEDNFQAGIQYTLLNYKYRYLGVSLYTGTYIDGIKYDDYSNNSYDYEGTKGIEVTHFFPIELQYPIYASNDFELFFSTYPTNVNLFSKSFLFGDNITFSEVGISLIQDTEFLGMFCNYYFGYRFQHNDIVDEDHGKAANFNNLFFRAEMAFGLNMKIQNKIITLLNPNLTIQASSSSKELTYKKDEHIQILVKNTGKGKAEFVILKISVTGATNQQVGLPEIKIIGDIDKNGSKLVNIPLSSLVSVDYQKKIEITIKCEEKDKFYAIDTLEFVLLPYNKKE